jgi:hypothetical protein
MAGFDVITAGYHKVHLSKADIGTFICQSNGRVKLTHRSSFPKAISDVFDSRSTLAVICKISIGQRLTNELGDIQ